MRDARARQLLLAEARRLDLLHQAIAGDITEGQADADDRPASDIRGPAAASVLLEQEVEESLRLAVDDERAGVALALARLDAGTFGTCVTCGARIPDDRIDAVPATRFCVGCEALGERADGAPSLPLIDAILRAALEEVDGWDDDGPDEDEVVVLAPEELAVHRTPAGRAEAGSRS